MSGAQRTRGSKSQTHKFEKKHILIIIMPMYKRERVRVLVTVSSLFVKQKIKGQGWDSNPEF